MGQVKILGALQGKSLDCFTGRQRAERGVSDLQNHEGWRWDEHGSVVGQTWERGVPGA